MKFPKNFLWGASSAAYQIEGAVNEDGRGKINWDYLLHSDKGIAFENSNGDVAADHYHKVEEDIKLMAEMGMKSYRFSIAWSRIFPNGDGVINQKGIDFYKRLINELKKYNIVPIVTMHHFDTPFALEQELKDWTVNPEFTKRFLAYAKVLFNEYGKDVKHWIVFNEPNMFSMMATRFGFASRPNPRKSFYEATFKLAYTHAKTIELYNSLKQGGLIGSSVAQMYSIPLNDDPKTKAAYDYFLITEFDSMNDIFGGVAPSKKLLDILAKEGILPNIDIDEFSKEIVKHKPTFIGVNYYSTNTVTFDEGKEESGMKINNTGKKGEAIRMGVKGKWTTVLNPKMEMTDWGWPIHPQGLYELLMLLEKKYHLPTLISENGLGAKDVLTADGKVHDEYRIEYLRRHIEACGKAIADGSKLFAYNPWSVMDLFSWMNGYQKRYGFIYVNRTEHDLKDLARIKKDSFYWYQKVIKTNGDDLKS